MAIEQRPDLSKDSSQATRLPAGEVPTGIDVIEAPLAETAKVIGHTTKWPLVGALGGAALTLAGLGGAAAMYLSADKGPSAPPVDNVPVSDTFKPSPEQPGIVVNPAPITPNVGETPVNSDITPPQTEQNAQPVATEPEQVEVNCGIFGEKFAANSRLVESENPQGQKGYLIGWKNLPPGEPIPFPIAGIAAKAALPAGGKFKGTLLTITNPNAPAGEKRTHYFRGDMVFGNMIDQTGNVNDVAARVGGKGIENQGWQILYTIGMVGPQGTGVTDVEALKILCPAAFAKPTEKYTSNGTVTYVVGPAIYRD